MIITFFIWYFLFYPKTSHRQHKGVGNMPVVLLSLFLIWICVKVISHKQEKWAKRLQATSHFNIQPFSQYMHVQLRACQHLCAACVCMFVNVCVRLLFGSVTLCCVVLLPLTSQRDSYYRRQGYTPQYKQTHTHRGIQGCLLQ